MTKKLIEVNDDTWKLLKIYSKWKDIELPTALDDILKEKLEPLKNALEMLKNE